MKKYDEFVKESIAIPASTTDNIDSVYKDFYYKVKKFINNNILTERGLNFKKDSDQELKSKLQNPKYKEYHNKIKDILKHRENENIQEK